jgi:hypothetical protein
MLQPCFMLALFPLKVFSNVGSPTGSASSEYIREDPATVKQKRGILQTIILSFKILFRTILGTPHPLYIRRAGGGMDGDIKQIVKSIFRNVLRICWGSDNMILIIFLMIFIAKNVILIFLMSLTHILDPRPPVSTEAVSAVPPQGAWKGFA